MESELKGRLRNTHLPTSKGLMPLYEAVVNSIQGCEEDAEVTGNPLHTHEIKALILRSAQLPIGLSEQPVERQPIDGFSIEDDGIGFNDQNYDSFCRLDSLWKQNKGCRGIGRLMWLKTFNRAKIDSVFESDGILKKRTFSFDILNDVKLTAPATVCAGPKRTRVTLEKFDRRYQESTPKTARTIATGLLEHCLWYFVREAGVPKIVLADGDDVILLDELYDEHMHADAKGQPLVIKGHQFELTHVKFRAGLSKAHTLNYCAAGRLVVDEQIRGKIPGLFGPIEDIAGTFTYSGYLTSPYLDERAFEQRIGFNIEEEVSGIFADLEISFADMRSEVLPLFRNFSPTLWIAM